MILKDKKALLKIIALLIVVGGVVCLTLVIYRSRTTPVNNNDQNFFNNEIKGQILFRVQVSKLGMQVNNSLIGDKQPADFVEVKLPGVLYDPPKKITAISRQAANWDTPFNADEADFSALKTDDYDWIINDFALTDQAATRLILDKNISRERQAQFYGQVNERDVIGWVEYKNYIIMLDRDLGSKNSLSLPHVYKKTDSGWKRTNDLSSDEISDVITSTMYNNGEIKMLK
jgi:hypothetical protein